MGDWLGTGTKAQYLKKFRSFENARAFVRKLKLQSAFEWQQYSKGALSKFKKKPDDIPSTPGETYANKGWVGFGDWLGTGRVANQQKKFRSFKKARIFAHQLKLKNVSEWRKYTRGKVMNRMKLPIDIPANPEGVYKNEGWKGYGDWIGTKTRGRRKAGHSRLRISKRGR